MAKKMRKFKFNTQIYKREAIQKTISDYSDVAKFKIKIEKDRIVLMVDPLHKDAANFKNFYYDLANYILGMTKKCL